MAQPASQYFRFPGSLRVATLKVGPLGQYGGRLEFTQARDDRSTRIGKSHALGQDRIIRENHSTPTCRKEF